MVSLATRTVGYYGEGLLPKVVIVGTFTPAFVKDPAGGRLYLADRLFLGGLASSGADASFDLRVSSDSSVSDYETGGLARIPELPTGEHTDPYRSMTDDQTTTHPSLVRVSSVQQDPSSLAGFPDDGSVSLLAAVRSAPGAGSLEAVPSFSVTVVLRGHVSFGAPAPERFLGGLDLGVVKSAFYFPSKRLYAPVYITTDAGWTLGQCHLYGPAFPPDAVVAAAGDRPKIIWHP